MIEPWAALNHGSSLLAPRRCYQLPDADLQATRADHATNEDAFIRAYNARAEAGVLTQCWANEYADRLGVPRVKVPIEPVEPATDEAPASGVQPVAA